MSSGASTSVAEMRHLNVWPLNIRALYVRTHNHGTSHHSMRMHRTGSKVIAPHHTVVIDVTVPMLLDLVVCLWVPRHCRGGWISGTIRLCGGGCIRTGWIGRVRGHRSWCAGRLSGHRTPRWRWCHGCGRWGHGSRGGSSSSWRWWRQCRSGITCSHRKTYSKKC